VPDPPCNMYMTTAEAGLAFDRSQDQPVGPFDRPVRRAKPTGRTLGTGQLRVSQSLEWSGGWRWYGQVVE
jgi:hypothetical protein